MSDATKPETKPDELTVVVQPAAKPPRAAAKPAYFWGTGRRKTAVARVRLRPGSGKIIINDLEFERYFTIERQRVRAKAPLVAAKLADKLDIFANVNGGGPFGQADAVLMGVARALLKMDPALMPILRTGGFLTRDAREVERKKYGRAGARRSFQFSKR